MARHSKKRWLGQPPVCDVCGHPPMDYFVDGRSAVPGGPWGLHCQDCWKAYGCGRLGTGFGQAYSAEPPYYAITDELPKSPA